MKAKLDLTGHRYERLLVLSRGNQVRHGRYKWLCICDCGNQIYVLSDSLRSGNTKSCGCLAKESVKTAHSKDISGKRFGRLIVISKSERRQGNRPTGTAYWWCLCDCGNKKEIARPGLISGSVLSCGCLNRELSIKRFKKHGKSKTNEYWYAHARKRREQEENINFLWSLDMETMLHKVQPFCVVCGSKNGLAVDHVYPLSKGYGLQVGNAVILCKHCNSKKGAKFPQELDVRSGYKILLAAESFKSTWSRHVP